MKANEQDMAPENIKAISIIGQMLNNRQRASIAFIVGNVSEYGNPSVAARSELLNKSEQMWMNYFSRSSDFSVVDRNHVAQIIDEAGLSSSGYISASTRMKIGELTGATHLVIIEAQRYESFWINKATTYWKLTDIQTGRVLSIDEITYSKFRVL